MKSNYDEPYESDNELVIPQGAVADYIEGDRIRLHQSFNHH